MLFKMGVESTPVHIFKRSLQKTARTWPLLKKVIQSLKERVVCRIVDLLVGYSWTPNGTPNEEIQRTFERNALLDTIAAQHS